MIGGVVSAGAAVVVVVAGGLVSGATVVVVVVVAVVVVVGVVVAGVVVVAKGGCFGGLTNGSMVVDVVGCWGSVVDVVEDDEVGTDEVGTRDDRGGLVSDPAVVVVERGGFVSSGAVVVDDLDGLVSVGVAIEVVVTDWLGSMWIVLGVLGVVPGVVVVRSAEEIDVSVNNRGWRAVRSVFGAEELVGASRPGRAVAASDASLPDVFSPAVPFNGGVWSVAGPSEAGLVSPESGAVSANDDGRSVCTAGNGFAHSSGDEGSAKLAVIATAATPELTIDGIAGALAMIEPRNGTFANGVANPATRDIFPTETLSIARTTTGSNWVPAFFVSS